MTQEKDLRLVMSQRVCISKMLKLIHLNIPGHSFTPPGFFSQSELSATRRAGS